MQLQYMHSSMSPDPSSLLPATHAQSYPALPDVDTHALGFIPGGPKLARTPLSGAPSQGQPPQPSPGLNEAQSHLQQARMHDTPVIAPFQLLVCHVHCKDLGVKRCGCWRAGRAL
jgi:hypothetical protein